jgi:hypothetical protein
MLDLHAALAMNELPSGLQLIVVSDAMSSAVDGAEVVLFGVSLACEYGTTTPAHSAVLFVC